MKARLFAGAVFLVGALVTLPSEQPHAQQPQGQPSQGESPQGRPPQGGDDRPFRFKTGVDLINVTATVTDASGRFVSGLRKDDFSVFEDGRPQAITHFNSERVPVSLGIVLDTSASMDGEKIIAARDALNRFLFDLLDHNDEVFVYRFDSVPDLVTGWTTDRERIRDALGRIRPRGGTALYDTLAEAIPLAQTGKYQKKAIVIISDGNDTSSRTDATEIKRLIRETEVLVYAVGVDAQAGGTRFVPYDNQQQTGPIFEQRRPRFPIPFPFPTPGGRQPPGGRPPRYPPSPPTPRGGIYGSPGDERVNVAALRDITDDSGGRTEIIRSARDLNPATAGIADELSKQYYLGYPAASAKDGRWHTIRVEVDNASYHVRARRGYMATP
jgi:VWFA-related protein